MTLGFVFTFFDFRNDMRKVLEVLAKEHNVIVFVRPEDADKIQGKLPPGAKLREIHERIPLIRNRVWEKLFLLFRKIPASSENYFLMEEFKIQNLKSAVNRWKGRWILLLQKLLPKFLSYDTYISNLKFSAQTDIQNIDKYFFLTEIYDDYFLARLLHAQKDISVYVYSWDHPCKHVKFPSGVKYAVWNSGITDDLQKLQHIRKENISCIGASQFGYIAEYFERREFIPKQYPFPYVYYACAVGIENIAVKEIEVIKNISELLCQKFPEWKFVVRPYPVLNNWELYSPLKQLKNIILDDNFRTTDLSVTEENIFLKYKNIEEANAFFHIGTTLGLEACFLQSKSFVINFGYTDTKDDLCSFIHQYQNEKYLIQKFPKNCINSIQQLEFVLSDLDNPGYNLQNEDMQKYFPVPSFHTFAQNLIRL